MLKMLATPAQQLGFAECFYFGREGLFNCMVMELLGRSLEDMVQKCGGKFQANTTVLVAQQVLQRVEYLHSKGVIHRDIKPENFMFGIKNKVHHVYMIDFGLSKKYWDKRHSAMRQRLSLTGTARYASINAHKGYEQSRRDDLEAIGHMFMYFLRGSVPWSGLDAKTKQEKYQKIMEKKEQVALQDLCKGHPKCFEDYLRYSRGLQFTERPDYDMIQDWFKSERTSAQISEDWQYEWFEEKPPADQPLVALQKRNYVQPDCVDVQKKTSASGNTKRRVFCLCGGGATQD